LCLVNTVWVLAGLWLRFRKSLQSFGKKAFSCNIRFLHAFLVGERTCTTTVATMSRGCLHNHPHHSALTQHCIPLKESVLNLLQKQFRDTYFHFYGTGSQKRGHQLVVRLFFIKYFHQWHVISEMVCISNFTSYNVYIILYTSPCYEMFSQFQ
jgi:hypothetical protein